MANKKIPAECRLIYVTKLV